MHPLLSFAFNHYTTPQLGLSTNNIGCSTTDKSLWHIQVGCPWLCPQIWFLLCFIWSLESAPMFLWALKNKDGTLPNFIKEKSTHPEGARGNQHPPAHLEEWMLSGQRPVFIYIKRQCFFKCGEGLHLELFWNFGNNTRHANHSEPASTRAPWRMDGKWSRNSFLLGSSSLANHGG